MKKILLPLFFSILLLAACKKDHPVDTGTATGTLHDWKGNCLPDIAHGAWYAGVTPGDSNYVEVGIYVEKKGTYHIVTDKQDGVQFSDAGKFIATGYQSVRLKPTGVFTHTGTIDFSVSFDHTVCGFSINVDTVPAVVSNRWKFTAKGRVYEGPATGKLLVWTDGSGSAFQIEGHLDNSTDTTIMMGFSMPPLVDTVLPGVYPTNDNVANNYFFMEAGHASVVYRVGRAQADKALLTIKIVGSFTPPDGGARQVVGTFTGTVVEEATGTATAVTDGSFSVSQ